MTENENSDNTYALNVIRNVINSGESVSFSGTGKSMEPTIREETDKVILSPISRPLKRGDICLYLRGGDKPVIHRIYRIKKDRCDMMGDSQFWLEKDVPKENIIAVAVKIIRNGEEIPLDKALPRFTAHIKAVKRRVIIFIKGKIRFLYLTYKKFF